MNGTIYNGGDYSSSGSHDKICLNILDTCVVALDVFIDEDTKIIYETDFLARAHSVSCKLQSPGSLSLSQPTSTHLQDEIVTSFYQDLYYADHYDELPGGVVLLRGSGWGR